MRRLVVKSKGKRYLVTVPEYTDIFEAAIVATPPPAAVVPVVVPIVAVAAGGGDFVASSYSGPSSSSIAQTVTVDETTVYKNQILFDGSYYKNYFTSSITLSASVELYHPSTYRVTGTQTTESASYNNVVLESGIYRVSIYDQYITESQNTGTIEIQSGLYSPTSTLGQISTLTGSLDSILLTGGTYLYSPTVSESSVVSGSIAISGEYSVTSTSSTDFTQNMLIPELKTNSFYNVTVNSTTESASFETTISSGSYPVTRFLPNTGSFGTGSFYPGSGENFDRLRYGNWLLTAGDYRRTYANRNYVESLNKTNRTILLSGDYIPESTVYMTAENTDYIVLENDTNNKLTLEN